MKYRADDLVSIISSHGIFLIFIVVFGFIFLFNLNRDLLTDWDECIYTSYAKTMRDTGDYLTHRWNGAYTLEKPPLYSWLQQAPFLFGVNEFTARINTLLFGLGLLGAVYLFAWRHFSRSIGIISVLLLLSSEVVIRYMSRANTDMGYTTFIFIAVYAWILSKRKHYLTYVSGIFFGLAVMIKGPGILPFLLALLASLFINYDRASLVRFLKMIIVTVIVAMPWHLQQYFQHGERFVQIYFFENILKRSQYPLEFHFEGRLFYLRLLARELAPWIVGILIVPISYIAQFRQFTSVKKIMVELGRREILWTMILLILIPLASITQVKTRIAWYAMPLYPFIAIFLAYSFDFLSRSLKMKGILYVVTFLLFFDALGLVLQDTRFFERQRIVSHADAVFLEAGEMQEEEINYLVDFAEREGRKALAPELYTSTTWIYGGNPCAHYYSGKKINYYYSIDEFRERMGGERGLFVIENGDDWAVKEGLSKKILYRNHGFTLFRI